MVWFKNEKGVEVFEIDGVKKYWFDKYGDRVIISRTNYYQSEIDPFIKHRYWDWASDYYEDRWDVKYKIVYDRKHHQTFSRLMDDNEKIPLWSTVSAVRSEKYKYWKNYKLID